MSVKIRVVMMSHLSDIGDLNSMSFTAKKDEDSRKKMIAEKAEFVKWLLLHHPDTDEYFDPDKEYDEFKKYRKL